MWARKCIEYCLYLGHCIDWLIKKCLQLTCNNPLLCSGAKWVKPILLVGKYMRLRSQTKRISNYEKKRLWKMLGSTEFIPDQ